MFKRMSVMHASDWQATDSDDGEMARHDVVSRESANINMEAGKQTESRGSVWPGSSR